MASVWQNNKLLRKWERKHFKENANGDFDYNLSYPLEDPLVNAISNYINVKKDYIYVGAGIRSILKELQEHHYVEIEKVRGDKGYFEYNYLIYEIPHFIDLENEQNNPDMENPHLDNPNVETATQINTNIINIKKQIDKDDKTKISSFFVPEEHNKLTLELIERGYINETDTQIFYYDKLFEQLLEEGNSYKDLVQIVHYIIPRVVNRKFKDEDGNSINNKYEYFKNAIESNLYKLKNPIENLWDFDDEFYDEIER